MQTKSQLVTIASAANTLPAALAVIRSAGFEVTANPDSKLIQAKNYRHVFIAEDVLTLLGLIKLYEARGDKWKPTDAEVENFLAFDGLENSKPTNERVGVWHESGAVHLICVTDRGDPVELNTSEARDFASLLEQAIKDAE